MAGLRAFIQPSDAKLLRTYYSASGNLSLLEHVSSTGAIQSDYYEFDETNRLNRIEFDRPVVGGTTTSARELSYNKAGEVLNEKTPASELRFSYDAQDRLVAVAGGSKNLIYDYAEDEPDIRRQLDNETQVNLLPWSNSGTTFGAANEIVHNRTRLAPYQSVDLDGDLDVFRLVSDIGLTLPHQAVEDSLLRMRLLDLGDAEFAAKAHFSRPSNVLFIPGEYRYINCFVGPPCDPNVIGDPDEGSIASLLIAGPVEADIEACNGGGNEPRRCAQNSRAFEIDGCSGPVDQIPFMATANATGTSVRFGSNQGIIPTRSGVNSLPCNQHDLCYQTCRRLKGGCDDEFASRMAAVCSTAYPAECPHSSVSTCQRFLAEQAACDDARWNQCIPAAAETILHVHIKLI